MLFLSLDLDDLFKTYTTLKMKKKYPYPAAAAAIATFMLQLIAHTGYAQTAFLLKPAPANISIDGSLTEWGDSLSYYNNETQVNYTFANDKDNLYLVLKTNNPVLEDKILASGITLSIDTKGKKKSSYSVTFPVQEQQGKAFGDVNTAQDKKLEIGLTKLRRLKADGFKDVEYDLITLQNTYGFKAAVNYNAHGFLVYEEAIPLALFHADDLKKNEWAFNIQINGHQSAKKDDNNEGRSSAMGGGRGGGRGGSSGGRGGGRGGAGRRSGEGDDEDTNGASSKSVDFWGKFILAKTF